MALLGATAKLVAIYDDTVFHVEVVGIEFFSDKCALVTLRQLPCNKIRLLVQGAMDRHLNTSNSLVNNVEIIDTLDGCPIVKQRFPPIVIGDEKRAGHIQMLVPDIDETNFFVGDGVRRTLELCDLTRIGRYPSKRMSGPHLVGGPSII